MMLRGLLILTVLSSSAGLRPLEASPPEVGPVVVAQDLEDLEREFRQACRGTKLPPRVTALEAILALDDPRAIPGLVSEMARAEGSRREYVLDVQQREAEIERDERVLQGLETRAERDESLKSTIGNTRARLREKKLALKLKRENFELDTAWSAALAEGISGFLNRLPANKSKSVLRGFEKDAKGSSLPDVQFASIILLGYTAPPKTALTLQNMMAKAVGERDKAAKKVPKLEKTAAKLEKEWQDAVREDGRGIVTPKIQRIQDQYNEAKREASAQRRVLQVADAYAELCVEAGARILERGSGEALTNALVTLSKAAEKAKGAARLHSYRMLATSRGESVRMHLRGVLKGTQDPAALAQLIDDLAALGDTSIEDLLITSYLNHESWHVRARAAAALATLRSGAGVPALIARLAQAEGREKTDLRDALMSLTARDFRTNATLWQRWWDEEGADFAVATEEELAKLEAKEDGEGVTFFGIRTESQRVIFIVDTSGSMEWSMVVRTNPEDNPNQPPDLPKMGEKSRLLAAKEDLKKAIGGLRDGAQFNIVVYAADVTRWKPELQTMTPELREEVLAYVTDLGAIGGTNIFGGLKEAFQMAGVDTERTTAEWVDPSVDTIFLLSDGKATFGTVTNNDGILSHVREWNRAAGIVLHTIGLSGAQDAYLLRNLAEQNHGEYAAR